MSNTAKTSKGSVLPLMKLKGKDYLLIAHRLLWLNDDYENFTISTEIVQLTETYAVVRSSVALIDPATGTVIRSATASKRETQKDFADFLEKAETGAIGRALAMVGLGTQFAQQDMEEGDRLADAPLEAPKAKSTKESRAAWRAEAAKELVATEGHVGETLVDTVDTTKVEDAVIAVDQRVSTFRKDRQPVSAATTPANGTKGGWR